MYAEIVPQTRILMGAGPSEVPPRVYRAMATPLVAHLDPTLLGAMDRIQEMLRALYQTKNRLTFPITGTGTAGLETCITNLLEPGDTAVVGVIGVFGERIADTAERTGARVVRVEAPWGEILSDAQMAQAIARENPKVVALVHAETSTGALQPVREIARAAREAGALTVLDCVTSLGGHPVEIDAWGIDAAYSASQKCLNCPPGLSPVTFSDRAMERILARKTKPRSWYLDLALASQYWSEERAYHTTPPVSMLYALHESLRIIMEEGLEARYARHRRNHEALSAGIRALGLELASPEGHRLWDLNTIRVPEGVDEADVRRRLVAEHGIEIGAAMGRFTGKIWRVGLMGASSTTNHVLLFLAALGKILGRRA